MTDHCSTKTARIRELNDQLRCKAIGGRIVITRGIEALGDEGVAKVLAAVARFDSFTEDNDPWGEHDCAVLNEDGRRIMRDQTDKPIFARGLSCGVERAGILRSQR